MSAPSKALRGPQPQTFTAERLRLVRPGLPVTVAVGPVAGPTFLLQGPARLGDAIALQVRDGVLVVESRDLDVLRSAPDARVQVMVPSGTPVELEASGDLRCKIGDTLGPLTVTGVCEDVYAGWVSELTVRAGMHSSVDVASVDGPLIDVEAASGAVVFVRGGTVERARLQAIETAKIRLLSTAVEADLTTVDRGAILVNKVVGNVTADRSKGGRYWVVNRPDLDGGWVY